MNRTPAYALLVFLAGSSYGFIVPCVKIASAHGVDVTDFLPAQYLLAFLLMAAVTLARRISFAKPAEMLKLAGIGVATSCTSLCYYSAVSLLPSAVALTLLFQFVWIGVAINSIAERKLPDWGTVIAMAVVLAGTVFAAGLFDASFSDLDPKGIAFGLGSAVFYALFLFLSGKVGTEYALPMRTMMLSFGGFLVTSAMNPGFFTGALWDAAIWPYAVLLAFLGIIVPTSLIAFASPKIPAGMVTIMASSELPVGVLAAWAIVADVPSPTTLFGVFLVLAGIIGNQLPALKESFSRKNARS